MILLNFVACMMTLPCLILDWDLAFPSVWRVTFMCLIGRRNRLSQISQIAKAGGEVSWARNKPSTLFWLGARRCTRYRHSFVLKRAGLSITVPGTVQGTYIVQSSFTYHFNVDSKPKLRIPSQEVLTYCTGTYGRFQTETSPHSLSGSLLSRITWSIEFIHFISHTVSLSGRFPMFFAAATHRTFFS
jgi:hypothetical protein